MLTEYTQAAHQPIDIIKYISDETARKIARDCFSYSIETRASLHSLKSFTNTFPTALACIVARSLLLNTFRNKIKFVTKMKEKLTKCWIRCPCVEISHANLLTPSLGVNIIFVPPAVVVDWVDEAKKFLNDDSLLGAWRIRHGYCGAHRSRIDEPIRALPLD